MQTTFNFTEKQMKFLLETAKEMGTSKNDVLRRMIDEKMEVRNA